MKLTNDINYVGVNDHNIDLFEGQYTVPRGMAYNSYVINDDKIAVIDSVDSSFKDEWFENISSLLNGKSPDYLIVQHMEPDHSANIVSFLKKYPSATIVANKKTFSMINNFFNIDFEYNKKTVENGDALSLGNHILTFIFAPMVHWPEVMLTYDSKDKVIFSADAFGKFGALDVNEDWDCEARRYYINIVGKYGAPVQSLLKKLKQLDIKVICPSHGPVLNNNLEHYIKLYDIWSSYKVETDGIMVAYTSVYGNTKKAVNLLAEKLKEKGYKNVILYDLARTDISEAVEDAFRYGKIVLATTTYNGSIFPFMNQFLDNLIERNFQNRTIGFIENGSWAPVAAKVMQKKLSVCKNINMLNTVVTVNSSVKQKTLEQINVMADELCEGNVSVSTKSNKKGFICKICGYIYENNQLPKDFICPICKHGISDFEPIL